MAVASAAELELNDGRIEFMCDYVMRTMKIKPDRWMKMYNVDENKQMFMDFFEKPDNLQLIIISNIANVLSLSFEWPATQKTKACYFVKKSKDPVQKDANIRSAMMYGDLSYAPVDQLAAFVDEVSSIQHFLSSSHL